MKQKLLKMVINGIILYSVVLVGMYVFQRSLMYFPHRNLQAPAAYGVQAEVLSLTTPDGVKLTAWEMPAAPEMPTILHLHGNAGNLSDRAEVYAKYHAAGFGVLALEWRGYGTSEGSPSEQGFYTDARTALQYLKGKGLAESDIVIYGESIGTGPAVQLATEMNPRALVLEAPFTSLWQRAAEIHWWAPAKYMVRDRYESFDKIQQIDTPLLIFHNTGDRIVPVHHGRALFAQAEEPKKLEIFEASGHVAFDRDVLAEKMKAFLALEPAAVLP